MPDPHRLDYSTLPTRKPSRGWLLLRLFVAIPFTLWAAYCFAMASVVDYMLSFIFGGLCLIIAVAAMLLPIRRRTPP